MDLYACDKEVESVFLHKQLKDPDRRTEYWSPLPNDPNKASYTIGREELAVNLEELLLRAYLEDVDLPSGPFKTGWNGFHVLLDVIGEFARLRLCLSQLEIDTFHPCVIQLQTADALSELKKTKDDRCQQFQW